MVHIRQTPVSSLTEGRDNMTIEREMNGAVLTPFIGQSHWVVVTETSGDPEDTVGARASSQSKEKGAGDSSVCMLGRERSISGDMEQCLCWLTEPFVIIWTTHAHVICLCTLSVSTENTIELCYKNDDMITHMLLCAKTEYNSFLNEVNSNMTKWGFMSWK